MPDRQGGTAQALYASVTGGIGMGAAMLIAGPLYADYGGRAYWAMAVIAGDRRWPASLSPAAQPSQPQSDGSGGMDQGALVAQAVRRGRAASSSGPSRSTQSASCASSSAGAIASEVATMQPTMILKPPRAGRRGQRQRLGQAAGLVELDVDGVVAAGERGEVGAGVQRFVGADRHRVRDRGQRRVGAGGQRLLDELEAGLGGDAPSARAAWPASRPRWRRRSGARVGQAARTWRMRSASPVAAELELEQRQVARRRAAALAAIASAAVEADACRRW